jgi:hypothetical protein
VSIILLNTGVFILELAGGDDFVTRWSAIPADIVTGHHLETILAAVRSYPPYPDGVDGLRRHQCARMRSLKISNKGAAPKDHSTVGKTQLGVISRAGDETLRSLLVVGATAVVWQARRGKSRSASPWLLALLKRKPPKLAAVALANKMARIAWKLMTTAEDYDARRALNSTA